MPSVSVLHPAGHSLECVGSGAKGSIGDVRRVGGAGGIGMLATPAATDQCLPEIH